MSTWTEKNNGNSPDGYPKFIYQHNRCDKIVNQVFPYCPYCGDKIIYIQISSNFMKDIYIENGFKIID